MIFRYLKLVVVFISSTLACQLNAADGDLKWNFTTDAEIISSPSIKLDGTIYVGSYDNNLYALNADGSLIWQFEAGDNISVTPSVGADGTIYTGSDDFNVYAINDDGTLKWTFATNGIINSWPSLADENTILIGSDDFKLYALNADGSLKWSYDTNGFVRSSPAIGSDGTIYFGSYDQNFYALNSDGTLKWKVFIGALVPGSAALSSDGTIYFGAFDNTLYALNPDGTEKWSYVTEGNIRSSPAIDSDGVVYVGSIDSYLYAINSDGSLKWRFATGNSVVSSPAINRDGTIFVGSGDSNIYAINSDGTLRWLHETQGVVDSSPAIANDGTVYIGSIDNNLYAIEGTTGLMDSDWPKFGQNSRHSGLTGDNDPVPGSLQLSSNTYSVAEDAGVIVVTVNRTIGSDGVVSVEFATVDNTASSTTDYLSQNTTLTLIEGELSKNIEITISDDNDYEVDETFNVALSNASGGAIVGNPSSAVVGIIDDQDPPLAAFDFAQSSYGVDESAGNVLVTVNRTVSTLGTSSVAFTLIAGSASVNSDYTAMDGTLDFGPGEDSKTITVNIINNSVEESSESFTIQLSGPVNAELGTQIVTTITISDDDNSVVVTPQSSGGGSINYWMLIIGGIIALFRVVYSREGNVTARQ